MGRDDIIAGGRGDGVTQRLTDRQRKKIIADRAEGISQRRLAEKYHVSETTIRRILRSDPETSQIVAEKKRQNTADILSYMEGRRDTVCEIIGKGLDVLNDPRKLAEATPSQITTALGTLIDKWTMAGAAAPEEGKEDAFSRSLRELAKELGGDSAGAE